MKLEIPGIVFKTEFKGQLGFWEDANEGSEEFTTDLMDVMDGLEACGFKLARQSYRQVYAQAVNIWANEIYSQYVYFTMETTDWSDEGFEIDYRIKLKEVKAYS